MDWTFWAGVVVLLVLWIGSQWLFSEVRIARKRRHEQAGDARAVGEANAVEAAEEDRREMRFWF